MAQLIRLEDEGRIILTVEGLPAEQAFVLFEEQSGAWAMECGRGGGIVRSDGHRETLEEMARIALLELLPEVRRMVRAHEAHCHHGRPQRWWRRWDGELVCAGCHPEP